METIILKGISRKGKNRVAGFGETWEVLKREDACMFGLQGTWVLIRPTKNPNDDLRWVCSLNDKDFEVQEVQQ